MLLTIGQMAEHVGVTVRAIRHYHERGLLPEPSRDASGYRRYDAQAVIDLVRIKVLVDSGVPLAHVADLLTADHETFDARVAEIDAALEQRIEELQRRRRQLRVLPAGERLTLPEEVVALLDRLRSIGVGQVSVRLERDGWMLMTAMCPDRVHDWVQDKLAALEDDEFRRLYLACDQAREWDADDPRLDELAHWMGDWVARRPEPLVGSVDIADATDAAAAAAYGLMAAQIESESPGWRRLGELRRADPGAG